MNAEKQFDKPSKALIYLCIGFGSLFTVGLLASVVLLCYSLVMGTFTQLLCNLGLFALTYYLATLFRKEYERAQYIFALEENNYCVATGKAMSEYSKRVLDRHV